MFTRVFRNLESGKVGNRHSGRDANVLNLESVRESFKVWLFASPTPHTVRREKALDFSGCNSRPGTGSLHPVAVEAAAEATKLSELSM
jgi:hypothetical protein